MFLWNTLKKTWRLLLESLPHDGRKELLAVLCQEYLEERKNSIQFQRHAERMQYPQFREKLLRIAEEEASHAQWLEGRIIALEGEVPPISVTPEQGFNSWEHLRLDLDEEKRCIWNLEEQITKVERLDPETTQGLRHILEEEKNHREVITDMLMRSDPQAELPV